MSATGELLERLVACAEKVGWSVVIHPGILLIHDNEQNGKRISVDTRFFELIDGLDFLVRYLEWLALEPRLKRNEQ